jgi:hypothetical protein
MCVVLHPRSLVQTVPSLPRHPSRSEDDAGELQKPGWCFFWGPMFWDWKKKDSSFLIHFLKKQTSQADFRDFVGETKARVSLDESKARGRTLDDINGSPAVPLRYVLSYIW